MLALRALYSSYACRILFILFYWCSHISLDQIKVASRIEEEFQVEIWGVVEGGHDMDRLNHAVRLASTNVFLTLYADSARIKDMQQSWKNA